MVVLADSEFIEWLKPILIDFTVAEWMSQAGAPVEVATRSVVVSLLQCRLAQCAPNKFAQAPDCLCKNKGGGGTIENKKSPIDEFGPFHMNYFARWLFLRFFAARL